MATKKNNKKKNGTLFTIACSILALLVMLIAFLVKKDQIVTNLKETSFFERVFGTTPEFVQNYEVKDNKKEKQETVKDTPITIKIESEKVEKTPEPYIPETVKNAPIVEEKKEDKVETVEKKEVKKTTVDLQLCFVIIDGNGSVTRKLVKRTVTKNDSPLVTAVNELLKGPDTSLSAEKNCMSVIPEGTKLLSAKVQNGVAYLSFNEKFEINAYGVEGYINQLMQVVYTATSFPTVNSVQFLIDGQKQDYLGPEGQWIGSPLSRNSF